MTLDQAIEMLTELNLINIGELGEKAISIATNIDQCPRNTPEIDLVNGVQIKTSQTNPERDKTTLRAWFTIKNCRAPIALTVTEKVTKKQYFFFIPYSAYQHVKANAISIPFDINGYPLMKNDWWYYNVTTWEKLCEKVQAC